MLLSALQGAESPQREPNFERLRQLVQGEGAHRIVVRSAHSYAALHWASCLEDELRASLTLHLGRRAAGLQPLGGLALALVRADSALSSFVEPLAQPGVG